MKLLALLVGIAASAFAWVAPYYMADLTAGFLALWPQTNSQQLLGLVVWHVVAAAPLAGGLAGVLSPVLGGLMLAGAAAGWAMLGSRLPTGFDLQLAVPLGLSTAAALAAFGAALRGHARRRAARRKPAEDFAREEALRLEPTVELRRALEEQLRKSAAEELPRDSDAEPVPIEAEPTPVEPPTPHRAIGDERPRGYGALLAANLAVLTLLTGAIALLLYSEYRSGALAAAFAATDTRMVEAGAAAGAEPTPVAPLEPAAAEPAAGTIEPMSDAAQVAEVRVTTSPFTARATTAWSDPFAYCTAVGTVDFPDRRYAGPRLVPAIAEALNVPMSSSPDRVRWRCLNGEVMACSAFEGAACATTPSAAEMNAFCASHPNAEGLAAPAGLWRCEGVGPVIPEADQWPVDARGFLPDAWIAVALPAAAGASLRQDGVRP